MLKAYSSRFVCMSVYLSHLSVTVQLQFLKTHGKLFDIELMLFTSHTGSSVELFMDETKTFSGLFFQDGIMKSNFAAFPEIIMVDATYKLNEFRMLLYLMLVLDSNGQGEIAIVSINLTSLETEAAITRMVQVFKCENPNWSDTKVVMSDKDFTERAVFEKEFPCASLLICLFHTLQSMRREVTCEKLGLRPGEQDHVLEVLTQLAYSKRV